MDTLQAGKTRWTHYLIGYHFVWIPKYRRKVLVGSIAEDTKRYVAEACTTHGFSLVAIETDIDHVHVFVSAPPKWAPATIVGLLKGYSSRMLRKKYSSLARACGHNQLWTQAYYVGTAGQVSAESIRRYIQECQGT